VLADSLPPLLTIRVASSEDVNRGFPLIVIAMSDLSHHVVALPEIPSRRARDDWGRSWEKLAA